LLGIYTLRRYNEKDELIIKTAEAQLNLQKTLEQLEVLMNSSSAILFRTKTDKDFTLIDTSENVKQVLGYSREEMFEKHFWANHLHPDDAPRIFKELPVLFQTGFLGFEYRFKHKDGSWPWMRAEMKCLFDENKKPYEMVGNWWDITQQKQTQEAMSTTNKQLELLMQVTSKVLVNFKATGDFDCNFISENVTKVLGYCCEEFFQKHFWASNVHPDDLPNVYGGLDGFFKSGSYSTQYRFRHKDGSWLWMQEEMKCLYDGEGKPYEIAATWWDITKDKQRGEAVRLANERFELSFKATRNVMYDWDLITNLQYWCHVCRNACLYKVNTLRCFHTNRS
jgi:PAS domain S-box-containing protein